MAGPKRATQDPGFALALLERLKAAKRNPTIYGYVPHLKQEEFHASQEQGRVFIGGNRSGKTVGGAVELVRAALGIDPYNKFPQPPLRLRGVTVDLKQGIQKIMMPEIARWVPPSALRNGSWNDSYNNATNTLTLDNGTFIELLTYEMDIEKHAGTSRHGVWFDEEAPEGHFQENLARLIDTGGRWWMTMTPVEGIEWIYQLYNDVVVEGHDRHVSFHEVESYDNPNINHSQIDALMVGMSQEDKDKRTKGRFSALGEKIYTQFDSNNVIDMTDWQPPSSFMRVNAMDHGWRAPTAWLFSAIDLSENTIYIFDEYYEAQRTVEVHAKHILTRELLYGPPAYRVGDPAIKQKSAHEGTSIQYEYSKHGVYIICGNNDVPAGINRVRELIGPVGEKRPRLIIGSHCERLLWEIKKYRFENYAHKKMEATRNKKETPMKKDDHAMDALRYLCAAFFDWRDNPPVEDIDGPPLGGQALSPVEDENDFITFRDWSQQGPGHSATGVLGDDW